MLGEIISILVAVFWASSALFFTYAGKKLSAMNLNLIRLAFAFVMIGAVLYVMQGSFLPVGASLKSWTWLCISGFIGFVFGDYFMFRSYQLISARITQFIMTLGPAFAALGGYLILGETLSANVALGMIVTLTGIAISVLKKGGEGQKGFHTELPLKGLVFAFFAAVGQGVGLVFSKQGLLYYNSEFTASSSLYTSIAGTQIRIICGVVFFLLIIALKRDWGTLINSFKEKKHIAASFGGAVVGPFIGVSLALMALQHTSTAIASTLFALVPIILIIPDKFLYKRKVAPLEILGAFVSVIGVALFFI